MGKGRAESSKGLAKAEGGNLLQRASKEDTIMWTAFLYVFVLSSEVVLFQRHSLLFHLLNCMDLVNE